MLLLDVVAQEGAVLPIEEFSFYGEATSIVRTSTPKAQSEKHRTLSRAAIGMALLTAGTALWILQDYRRWRALGPGGLPANLLGWWSMTRFRLQALDQLEQGPLWAAAAGAGDLQAWSRLRQRSGTRPAVSPYPIPHRQLTQLPPQEIRLALINLFDRMVQQHGSLVAYARSHYEKRHPAITLKAYKGKLSEPSRGEIAHIHPSDSSMHMILSASDAAAAMQMGWAQRHGLAGLAVGLPETYVMIYAPRNEQDLTVVEELLNAAIAYAQQQGRPSG